MGYRKQNPVTVDGVLYVDANKVTSSTSAGTAGQVITSNGPGVAPTYQAVSASGAVTTITGNSGGAEVPSSGNFNIVGTGSITVAGTANTETVQVTGLTNHAVLVGAGTATITKVGPTATAGQIFQSAGSSADPVFSTATYPSTAGTSGKVLASNGTNYIDSTATFPVASASSGKFIISDGTNWIASTPTLPNAATGTGTILRADGTNWVATTATYPTTTTANQLLYSSATNTVGGLATANSGVLTTSSAGVPSIDTTNFAVLSTGVQMKGNNTNTAPPTGFIGEKISAVSGTVGLTNVTPANVISVNLTAGVWDIGGMCLIGFTGTATQFQVGISTTSATITGSPGQEWSQTNGILTASGFTITIPNLRAVLSGTTTYYLVGVAFFTTGICNAFGSLQATRVG